MRDAQAGRYHHVRHFVVLTTGEYTEIEFYTSCSHILSCLLLVIEKQRQRKHWTVFASYFSHSLKNYVQDYAYLKKQYTGREN